MTLEHLTIDRDRVLRELDALATLSDVPSPAVTRVVFSDADRQARRCLTDACTAAGLAVRSDNIGNLFARWRGTDDHLPAVATGSHCDAIPYSGRYDGTVGVWGGLEALRSLKKAGFQPRRSIELIMFTSEEPTRYGIGCLGSRLMAGILDPDGADRLQDESGVTLASTRQACGYRGELATVRVDQHQYHAFVELHIEQGTILEQQSIDIGIVTRIAAPATLQVDYQGTGGHAGAVLMPERRDALLPAAELAIEVARAAVDLGGDDTVATTGVLDVFPRAVNSIPSRSHLEIDIRDTELARRDRVFNHISQQAHQIGDRHHQTTTVEIMNQDPPAECHQVIVDAIEAACRDAGIRSCHMVSRAYHDCLFMALICPSSMIFIPCRGGVSHHPDEYCEPEQIATGIDVLARTLARLSA